MATPAIQGLVKSFIYDNGLDRELEKHLAQVRTSLLATGLEVLRNTCDRRRMCRWP